MKNEKKTKKKNESKIFVVSFVIPLILMFILFSRLFFSFFLFENNLIVTGPNNGKYATLSKQCKTLEANDYYWKSRSV